MNQRTGNERSTRPSNPNWKPRPQGAARPNNDRYDRSERKPRYESSGNSLGALREIAAVVPKKVHVQPEPLKFEGPVNAWYSTKRNGVTHSIYLVEVRKDTVIFKDKIEDKHTQSLSLAKFMKFYTQA